MGLTASTGAVDLRESLFNDRAVGLANQIQLPREAVTRLHGLMVDLDANLLKPNRWFPPGNTAESFLNAILPALKRHVVLAHAEIRDTGRWLHALVWFREPVELHNESDQQHWANLHRILMGSVPCDPAAPVLNSLTRPVGSINSKTGKEVRTLHPGTPIDPVVLQRWARQVLERPFESIGTVLFGSWRTSPCPYCGAEDSQLDLGATVGLCYGPCKQVPLKRMFEAFMKDPGSAGTPPYRPVKKSARAPRVESSAQRASGTDEE